MKGHRMLAAVFAIVLASATGLAVADEGHEHGAEGVTVQGEILDMACYIAHEAKGADHAACAKRCVKGGQPMGLLTADGTVYLLYASHQDGAAFEQAKEHAGQQVEIAGQDATRAGIKGIEVHRVEAK